MATNWSGFYKLSMEDRRNRIKEFADLDEDDLKILANTGALGDELADRMIENVVGGFTLPLGMATNFLINGEEKVIPMAIEEPSVVAAASNAAKLARPGGGFFTSSTEPVMIGQIQVTDVKAPWEAKLKILEKKEKLLEMANEVDPVLVKFGGGARDVIPRIVDAPSGPMLVVHLLVDTRDAMGANAVNTMAETIAPEIERITGGRVFLRILSNLATYRLARARAVWKKEALTKGEWRGEDVVEGIIKAWEFAYADPYRAATHNKGIMNGVSAVVIATGNDFRAVEAGAHSYATIHGGYKPLTRYEINEDGDLVGTIEIPVAVGLIGGATKVHPTARVNVKILGVKTARELGEILAAVGLAQNFAALRALATEGIQRGHMKLHARNIAASVGAKGEEIDLVARRLVEEGKIRMDRAEEILNEIRKERGEN